MPDHLLDEVEMIVIGWFDEFDERQINAFYRSEEHTSELQSQSTISYAVFCLKKKKTSEFETMKA